MEQKELSMEEAFDRLNELLGKMEAEEHSLEETFRLYQEGLGLVKYCSGKIDTIEKQLIILEENGGTADAG